MTTSFDETPARVLLPETDWHGPMTTHPAVEVPEPMSIVWQGVEHPAARWDVHGFTLQTPIPRIMAPGRGRVFDVTLLIGQGGTRIEMRVQARAEGSAEDQAPTRYVFVDLDRAQSEVLHRIVDHVVADQALSLTRLLNETQETRAARHETGERMRHFRSTFQLSLAALVLAVAGTMTWTNYYTVRARYAAVTVGATSLSVPVPGMVSAMTVRPGQSVMTGDVLGYVRPSNHEDRLLALGDRRRALQAEEADLGARLGAVQQLAAISDGAAGTERGRLEETLRLAERRLSVERAMLASMQGNGLPTAARLRERARQEAVVLQAEAEVLEVRARLDRAARSEVLAPMGVIGSEMTGNTPTLQSMQMRLDAIRDELATLALREDRGTYGEPIVSPCDCVVQQIDRRPGEWADPSDQLAVLVGTEAPTVHALIVGDSARSIALGDRARVELADGSELTGHVARMTYDAHWVGYAGLQDNVFAADRYARVEIVTDAPLTAPVGMVAQVSVNTDRLLGPVRSMLGL